MTGAKRSVGWVASVVAVVLAGCGRVEEQASESTVRPTAPTTSLAEPSTTVTAVPETTARPRASTSTAVPSPPPPTTKPGTDPADQYLDRTTEIYRRTLPSGHDFVARRSTVSYADLFAYEWYAPTGTADMCMGDYGVLIGVPGQIGWWGSAWTSSRWYEAPSDDRTVVVRGWMDAPETIDEGASYSFVSASADLSEVALIDANQVEVDRAPVVNGLAMLRVEKDPAVDPGGLSFVAIDERGRQSAPLHLSDPGSDLPAECGPGEMPTKSLPAPGVQPADPGAAEAAIRERYSRLTKGSVVGDAELGDLLDDTTGVAYAIDRLKDGQFRDIAATAEWMIDDIVFTRPDEAWFEYTIETSLGPSTGRHGIATFNGKVWQITRATICQDLSVANVSCEPLSGDVMTPEWKAALEEWASRANLYNAGDGCPPLGQC
jgi:hypothetical protein